MLRDKVTKRVSEIQTGFNRDGFSIDKLMDTFKAMKLTESFSEFNEIKKEGFSFKLVISLMILMVLLGQETVNSSLSKLKEFGYELGKDVYYRLLNNPKICWRRILWHIGLKFIGKTESETTEEDKKRPHYLIFDDTTIEKTGKKMEYIGKVWDHVQQKCVLGYKMLVMLYWDGKSSIPLDFSVHRERGKKEDKPFGMKPKELRRQYKKKRSREDESLNRVKDLDMDKISMMLKMFFSAVYRNLRINYVLVDSWFTCDALINAVVGQGIHLIGMYKHVKTNFLYKGQMLNYVQINCMIDKTQYCRTANMTYKRVNVLYDGISVTLFFSRKGVRGDWKVILTTDTTLTFTQVLKHYQVRWTIEVFFKETKGLLNLGGCQSSNFDAQIAHATIVMITYILITFRFRFEHYESKGELFRKMNAECLRLTLDQRLWELFLEVIRVVAKAFDIDADDLLRRILTVPEAENLMNICLEGKYQEIS
jgi:hypothetical protein